MTTVDLEIANKLLIYNHKNGVFIWKDRSPDLFITRLGCKLWNAKHAGKKAGCLLKNGYRQIVVFHKCYRASRLAWLMHYGKWPENMIDHINHDRADDRIVNLRDVTNSENTRNQSRSKHNTSGFTGVGFRKKRGKWRARIIVDGKEIHLGYFDCAESAYAAYRASSIKYGFHLNHGSSADKSII